MSPLENQHWWQLAEPDGEAEAGRLKSWGSRSSPSLGMHGSGLHKANLGQESFLSLLLQ